MAACRGTGSWEGAESLALLGVERGDRRGGLPGEGREGPQEASASRWDQAGMVAWVAFRDHPDQELP